MWVICILKPSFTDWPCPKFFSLVWSIPSWNMRGRPYSEHIKHEQCIRSHWGVLYTFWKHGKGPEGESHLVCSNVWWHIV